MGVDRFEQAERDGADPLPRCSIIGHVDHDASHDVVGGRREQIVLVGDVPVDRPASCLEAGRERAEGQGALAFRVEDPDRGFDDARLRERVPAPVGPCPGRHSRSLT